MAEPLAQGWPEEPMSKVMEWLPGGPNQCLMTLATVDDGVPDARTLVLSEVTQDGFYFHTDAASAKVAQLAANPHVALTVLQVAQARQLVVQGVAERASWHEIARAYRDRGPYLQQLAWMNTDEFAALAEEDRLARWAEFAADHADGFVQPDGWTGFVVRPTRIAFWEGSPHTASRRIDYRLEDGSWQVRFRAG